MLPVEDSAEMNETRNLKKIEMIHNKGENKIRFDDIIWSFCGYGLRFAGTV
jgi:hypothetical protein